MRSFNSLINYYPVIPDVDSARINPNRPRSEVPAEDMWDLGLVYNNEEKWKQDLEKIKKGLPVLSVFEGSLNTADNVLACLETMFWLDLTWEKAYMFAHLKKDQDLSNDHGNQIYNTVIDLRTKLDATAAFIVPELNEADDEFLVGLTQDERFKDYAKYLNDVIRNKPHTLTRETEKFAAQVSETFSMPQKIYEQLTDVDMSFAPVMVKHKRRFRRSAEEKIELTEANFTKLLLDERRGVRRQATRNLMRGYHGYRNTLAMSLMGHVKGNVLLSRALNYPDVVNMFLHKKHIPELVYQTLIKTANKRLGGLHGYYALRKKTMGLDELHWYDTYVPMVPGVERAYGYDEAVELIMAALAPLGDDYRKQAEWIMTGGLADKYPNKGKRGGAYSSGGYETPPYMLLNFMGKLGDVFTLAHETGHSMHTNLSRQNQPYPCYRYKIFQAEIASTLNEFLLNRYLLENCADDKMRAYLVNKEVDGLKATFFRQTMFTEFEQMIYRRVDRGLTLSPKVLEKFHLAVNKRYFGPSVCVDEDIRSEWSRIPHFYYDFYVYQYATCVASAYAIGQRIINGEAGAVENYLEFLSSGGRYHPVESVMRAGVDTTKPDYLHAFLDIFDQRVKELKELLAK